jgi:hypothetical protein
VEHVPGSGTHPVASGLPGDPHDLLQPGGQLAGRNVRSHPRLGGQPLGQDSDPLQPLVEKLPRFGLGAENMAAWVMPTVNNGKGPHLDGVLVEQGHHQDATGDRRPVRCRS